jgi:hypothetical protein
MDSHRPLSGEEIVKLPPELLRKRLEQHYEGSTTRAAAVGGNVRSASITKPRSELSYIDESLKTLESEAREVGTQLFESIASQARAHLIEAPLKLLIFPNLVLSFHQSTLNPVVEALFDRLHLSVASQLLQDSVASKGPQWHTLAHHLGFHVKNAPAVAEERHEPWWERVHSVKLSLSRSTPDPPLLDDRVRALITSSRYVSRVFFYYFFELMMI